MSKRILTACMAVAAFAVFAILPATSSAVELTHPTGTTLGTGNKLLATNIGTTEFAGTFGTIVCEIATMTGTLTKNNGTEVQGTIESANFSGTGTNGDCTSPFGPARVTTSGGAGFNGTPYCLTLSGATVSVRGNGCANAARSLTFAFDFTSLGIECKYERTTATGPVTGTYTSEPSDAIAHIASGANSEFLPEAGNPFGCPGAGRLKMSFTVETDTATAEPVYLS